MNVWDRTFWMLFVLLEAAVVLASSWFFSPLAIIVGFVVVTAGFAKLGDYVFHKKTRTELRESREVVKKVTGWLDRQYELTQGIKNVYDHRFHHSERKRTEMQEEIERRYRELAGKIIELENRINLVSRVVISQKQRLPDVVREVVEKPTPSILVLPTVTAAAVEAHQAPPAEKFGFEAVWDDIMKLAEKRSISTLSRGVKNQIVSAGHESIVLLSELTQKERVIRKDEIKCFWGILNKKGRLNFVEDLKYDPKLLRMGSIVISFFARLPYVEYGLKPRMLYLLDHNSHTLGTLKRKSKSI